MCGLPACSNLPRTQFASCCPFPRNTGFSNPNLIKFFKVLNLWIMDQVPIGNKTPRPGYARQIWCPACRGLLETPLALTSGHVLLDCMVVEGTCQSKFSPCTSTALLLVQVHACVKGSDLSWMSARQQGEVKNLPTLCMSMVLIQWSPGSLWKNTCWGVPAFQGSRTCGSTPGGKIVTEAEVLLWNVICIPIYKGCVLPCCAIPASSSCVPFQNTSAESVLSQSNLPPFYKTPGSCWHKVTQGLSGNPSALH